MLQNLLTERFRMQVRRDRRELQGFDLVTGRGGPKLKPSAESDGGPPTADNEPPKTNAEGYPQLDRPSSSQLWWTGCSASSGCP